MYQYNYLGIDFEINIECSFFYPTSNLPKFHFYVNDDFTPQINSNICYCIDDCYIINFEDRGYYKIDINRNEVLCNFYDISFLKATICNLPFSIICLANNIFPLHCSSVEFENSIISIIGKKGTGKSTIALLLSRLGYSLFSDDAIGLRVIDNDLFACRGVNSLKLCGDICDTFNVKKVKEVYANWNKYYYTPLNLSKTIESRVRKLYIAERSLITNVFTTAAIPNQLKSLIINHNVVSGDFISNMLYYKINELSKQIINSVEIQRLYIPNGLENLKARIADFQDQLLK